MGTYPGWTIYEVHIDDVCSCSATPIASTQGPIRDPTFSPEGDLYANTEGSGGHHLLKFNFVTNEFDFVALFPPQATIPWGMLCVGNGVFYILQYINNDTRSLNRWNLNSGTWTTLGNIPFYTHGLTMFDGQIYTQTWYGMVVVDTLNPASSLQAVDTYPYFLGTHSISGSHLCNTIIGIDAAASDTLWGTNILDGSVRPICKMPEHMWWITSIVEHDPAPLCSGNIDLDCDDSSGATGADFNTLDFTCLSGGVPLADIDDYITTGAEVDEMTIVLIDPLPNEPNEFLIGGGIPGISVSGSGSTMITLTNQGNAKVQDFEDALRSVLYVNTEFYLTPGPRQVEVQFTSISGELSNVATAHIQVVDLPYMTVDLGPDQMRCDGETATFNAGNPGASYHWSTSQSTQAIIAGTTGQYVVTVSNGVQCPNKDTVELEIIPVIEVSLTGDIQFCENEEAILFLNTNSVIPVDIIVEADPGSAVTYDDVSGTYSFTDWPLFSTGYTITDVISSLPACIEITDPTQFIEMYPLYISSTSVSLCDGDSIWLGNGWKSEAGVYENLFESIHGCDSIITTTIDILPAVTILYQATTCDSSEAGVYYQYLENLSGCDTVVQTTISLLPLDTTYLFATTCVSSQAGVSQNAPIGTDGCDSLVITTTTYIPPADTTYQFGTTCDSAQTGVLQYALTGVDGCDSLVITTVTFALGDTTYLFDTTCDPAQVGVSQNALTGVDGCDSLLITTLTFAIEDTTYLFDTTCDPAQVGISQNALTGIDGCDSLVISTVTFALADTTYLFDTTCDPSQVDVINHVSTGVDGCDSLVITTITLSISHQINLVSSSCNPTDTGVFVQQLTNQFGCDSIITETVSLLPSDQTFLASTTCISSEAGMFITTHLNKYGCDSIVTLTVSLVAADTTQFNFNTCEPAQTGSIETMFVGQDGCDSLVIQTTSLYPLPVLIVESAIDYNGFDVSCKGSTDGSAIANVTGVPSYTYLWSTNDTDQMITGLSAGDYDVAITDGNGCMTFGTVTLTQPDTFMIGFEVSEPDCFDQQLGSIIVLPSGGVAPYTYSIDGTVFQTSPVFTGLDEGIYQITSLDANDCSTTEIISIDVPLMVNVELGTNQSISIGDTTLLEAIINLPFDSLASIIWTGIDSIGCANCLTQIVAPIITTAYSVSVTSADGCADRDSMTVFVNTDYKLYIPNIFSPNGDGINDVIMISADESVHEIASFSIFDRWGNLVFGAEYFQPNDASRSWDGKLNGEAMNPGVFTFRVVVDFSDGESEVIYGDITLVR